MRRMVWVALGAAGGIVAYRRLEQALEDARQRGVVLSAQQAGLSAVAAATRAREIVRGAASADLRPRTTGVPKAGSAAAHVMAQVDQRGM